MADDTKEKMILVFYYIGKLVEAGLATSGPEKLTTSGFDMAMDLIKSGLTLDKPDIIEILSGADITSAEDAPIFADLILEIQDKGFKTKRVGG